MTVVPTILLDDVVFSYDGNARALDGVSLELGKGCVGVLGRNGSGKSTLMKHFNGLLRPTSGRVLVRGVNTGDRTVAALAREIGLAFQNPDDQIFHSSVRAEVRFGARMMGFPQDRVDELVRQSLARLGLSGEEERNPMDFGFSVRKLIAIASVLAMDTGAVVLDEPTAGQDAAGLAALERLCHDLVADGRLVVVVTHDVEFAARTADRVVVLHDGRVILDGPAAETLAREEELLVSNVRPPLAQWLATRLGFDSPLSTIEQLVERLAETTALPEDIDL